MGTSAIDAIYTALGSDIAPTPSTDITVHVEKYGAVRDTLQADDLPLRKLQAFANDSGGEMAFVSLGTTITVTWTIVDRLYYRIATMGMGWQEFADELTKYAASYINIMRLKRALTSQSHVTGISFKPQIFTFPEGGDTRVAGVDVILTIEEVIA
jgi:hypothetical protein